MKESNEKVVRIVGAGFGNKGAEAMLFMTAEAVRRRLTGAAVVVRLHPKTPVLPADNDLMRFEKDPPRRLIRRILAGLMTPENHYASGAVIDIGGYQFGDPWGTGYAQYKERQVKKWIRAGDPVFFLPQAWGPFSSASISRVVSSIVNSATLSYARDKTSLAQIQKLVGTNHPKLRLAHDIAWNFKGEDLSVGNQFIREAGLPEKGKSLTICLTPNRQVYQKTEGSGPQNKYIILLTAIVEHLCRAHKAQIILLGHQFTQDNTIRDDRTLCNYILSALDRSLPVAHLDKELSAAGIKSVIGNCDLLLSSRYHALIAAMSQGIPSAAIGWSHKYDELMSDVGLSSNIILLSETEEHILQKVDLIVEQKEQAREMLKTTVPPMKQSGQKALDDVLLAIQERFQG